MMEVGQRWEEGLERGVTVNEFQKNHKFSTHYVEDFREYFHSRVFQNMEQTELRTNRQTERNTYDGHTI